MSGAQSWLPEPLGPEQPVGSAGADRGGTKPVPYDQPFGVGQPPPTFYERRSAASGPDPAGFARSGPSFGFGAGQGFVEQFSILSGLAMSWEKVREHLLEWVLFAVTTAVFTFAVAFALAFSEGAIEASESGALTWFLLNMWMFGINAMAVQAALVMMVGRRVRFLAFFRIPNALSILVLSIVFGAITATMSALFAYGEYAAVFVVYAGCLAMAGAIEDGDGPLGALMRCVTLSVEFPGPILKLMIATAVFSTVLGFIPVLGGGMATAVSALMIAYGFRVLQERPVG